MTHTVFVLHALATWWMTGLIWLIQVVHYPLFSRVGAEAFDAYHRLHVAWITPVVVPAMLVELAGAVWLLADRPDWMPPWAAAAGLALVGVAWLSTFFLSVPAHSALGAGLDVEVVDRLVRTNLVRTLAWTLRAALVGALLARALGGSVSGALR